jgi:hypothetical protein
VQISGLQIYVFLNQSKMISKLSNKVEKILANVYFGSESR